MFKNSFSKFRTISFIEGISYLVLLFMAMPLKYFAGMPVFVKVVGMAHGILFTLFFVYLYFASKEHNFGMKFNITAFIASLVPFGTFVLEKRLKEMAPVGNN
jgi:integral membrane protein